MEQNLSNETLAEVEKKLRYISAAIKQSGRRILKDYPITSPQFIALQWLVEEGDLTIGQLSTKHGLAFSTTTDLVDRMENNQLVERVRDTGDRRVVRIQVLEKGKTIIEEVIEERRKYLGEVLQNFSLEQTIDINELLSFLHEQMKSVNEK